ncbi:MAG: type II toxin-antitoxin system RelE/ParE family toxin [Marinobacter sp.]
MKLVYMDEAIEDLKRLREFIAIRNPSTAARITTELGRYKAKPFNNEKSDYSQWVDEYMEKESDTSGKMGSSWMARRCMP